MTPKQMAALLEQNGYLSVGINALHQKYWQPETGTTVVVPCCSQTLKPEVAQSLLAVTGLEPPEIGGESGSPCKGDESK